MPYIAAIYGFEFSRPFTTSELYFEPISTDGHQAKLLARDCTRINLTGTVSSDQMSAELIYRLEAILSFIEHLEVNISVPVIYVETGKAGNNHFPLFLQIRNRNNGGGAVIREDTFDTWRDSRKVFIELMLQTLADTEGCKKSKVNSLLFKIVETYRQRRPFIEISYFLIASGLESFCRAHENDYKTDAAVVMREALRRLGLHVHANKPDDLPRSVQTYMHIRNALFHQGDYTKTVKMDRTDVELDCVKYFYHFQMLASLTLMKAVGFDDGHTNWDAWIDRQMHI